MNNSKSISTKRTSAIFLAIVLVTGTITALSNSSFIIRGVEAQGDSYYGNDNGYYESQYSSSSYKSNDHYKPTEYSSYGEKDNNNNIYKSTKDSSSKNVNIKKIKCNNINININNGQGGSGNGDNNGNTINGNGDNKNVTKKSNKDDFAFVCINNNNNIVTGSGGNQTIPTTGSLTVKKEIFGCTPAGRTMDCSELDNNSPFWLSCDNPAISNSDVCLRLPENFFDIEVLDDQNNQIQEFEGSQVGTTIQNLEPGTYTVNEIKHQDGVNQLTEDESAQMSCNNALFAEGGSLLNTPNLLYTICFEYEDEQGNDCTTNTIAAGEEKTCIVKNYIQRAQGVL